MRSLGGRKGSVMAGTMVQRGGQGLWIVCVELAGPLLKLCFASSDSHLEDKHVPYSGIHGWSDLAPAALPVALVYVDLALSCLHAFARAVPCIWNALPARLDVAYSNLHSSLNSADYRRAFLDPPSRSNCSLL